MTLPQFCYFWHFLKHDMAFGFCGATRRRVGSPQSASGIRRHGRSREGGASMLGREQCPTQTGRCLSARGDQRGRGTQIEYDRKGQIFPLTQERHFHPKCHILFQEIMDIAEWFPLVKYPVIIVSIAPPATIFQFFALPSICNHKTVDHLCMIGILTF